MVNRNLYEDKPYFPSRDPREVNIVDRLKEVKDIEPTYVNDEDIQHADLEKEVHVIVEEIIKENNGETPGGGNTGGDVVYKQAIISAATHEEFPRVGSEEVLYLATEENEGNGYLYRWCKEQGCYLRPEDSTDDISLIEGGNAFSGTL